MKPQTVVLFSILGLLITTLSSCVTTRSGAKKEEIKPYPFNHCAVNRKPFTRLEGPKYTRVHEGYEVQFCCLPCVRAFDINPEPWMPPIHEHYENLANNPEPEKKKAWFQ